jgi:ComF family protein
MVLFSAIVDTLFPPACWVDPAMPGVAGLSEGARVGVAVLAAQGHCHRCGLTTGPHEQLHKPGNPCGRCGERVTTVRCTARVGTFTEPLVTLVHKLKFGRQWEIARTLAPFLHHAIARTAQATREPVDALVPIPLHWMRRARRGFNQSEELAREVGRLSGHPVMPALVRRRRTREQARLESATARRENLQHAFVAKRLAGLGGKSVWLIDDVSTTGATLHAAATALRVLPKEFRPAAINAAVLCITDHAAPPAALPELDGF